MAECGACGTRLVDINAWCPSCIQGDPERPSEWFSMEETSERAIRLGCAGDGSPADDLRVALDEVERLRGGKGLWSLAELAVLEEREKQRQQYGDAFDDGHTNGELAAVAACLAHPDEPADCPAWGASLEARTRGDRRRQLVIAAALCIAEIERLDRAGEVSSG